MTVLEIPAVHGNTPHGWLAGVGLSRVLSGHWPDLAVRWHDQYGHLVLTRGPESIDEVAGAVWSEIDAMPDDGLLPGVDPGWPPADARPGQALLNSWVGTDAQMWQRALVTPSAGHLHPLIAPHAAQTLGRMLGKILKALREDPGLLRRALTTLGMTEAYPAGLWILRAGGDGVKASASPGRDWLAMMAVPWMPVLELDDGQGEPPRTAAVGWRIEDGQPRPVLTWSLWWSDLPAADLPEHLSAAEGDPTPRYRWTRRRGVRTDPPMLRSLGVTPRRRPVLDTDDRPTVTLRLPPHLLVDLQSMVDHTNARHPHDPRVSVEEQAAALLESAALQALVGDPTPTDTNEPDEPGRGRPTRPGQVMEARVGAVHPDDLARVEALVEGMDRAERSLLLGQLVHLGLLAQAPTRTG